MFAPFRRRGAHLERLLPRRFECIDAVRASQRQLSSASICPV